MTPDFSSSLLDYPTVDMRERAEDVGLLATLLDDDISAAIDELQSGDWDALAEDETVAA